MNGGNLVSYWNIYVFCLVSQDINLNSTDHSYKCKILLLITLCIPYLRCKITDSYVN